VWGSRRARLCKVEKGIPPDPAHGPACNVGYTETGQFVGAQAIPVSVHTNVAATLVAQNGHERPRAARLTRVRRLPACRAR